MRDSNLLFFEDSLDDMLRTKRSQAESAVNEIPQEQFLVSSDDELVEHLMARFSVVPVQLHEEAMTMEQAEAPVDVSGDPMRVFMMDQRGPAYVPGTRVTVNLPYTGENWIFKYRTNPCSTLFPRSEVSPGAIRNTGIVKIVIHRPHDADPASFKQAYESELQLLRECVDRAAMQVESHNNGALPQAVRRAVEHRRGRIQTHSNIAALLDIPLAPREGAPPLKAVTIEVRKPAPLPKPPKSGLAPEPGIAPEQYEQILHFIRHQGRTFETTPKTYGSFQEENLRDVILAQLNGHFKGAASGEAFRRHGKTDIRIEQEDRAAFVAECKIWTGQSVVADAMDQLLGYLTWRDSKAALIMFNKKVKGFSAVVEKLPAAIREHALFVRDLECSEIGEWRVLMRSAEDEGRRVTVHIFAFNIYSD